MWERARLAPAAVGTRPVLSEREPEPAGGRLPAWLTRGSEASPGRRTAQLEAIEGSEPVARETPAPSVLPDALRLRMERALGGDFSAVRILQDGTPTALGARAYAQGSDLHFAPGEFDPDSPAGQALIGHELVHVLQQAAGQVAATTAVGGASVNDDPQLERDAATRGARAAGQSADRAVEEVAAPGGATPAADTDPSIETRLPESAEPSAAVGPGVLQLDEQWVQFRIVVTAEMTGAEFGAAADRQIFGGPMPGRWNNLKDRYTPAMSPVPVRIPVSMLKRQRAAAAKDRGIDVDTGGGIAGAAGRAQEFADQPPSQLRTQLIDEIDHRYYEARGIAPGTKIQRGDAGAAELWRTIRDEVLFQQQYLGNLPDKVKQIVKVSIGGREVTPAEYERMFRMAKRIEAMPLNQVADYVSKIAGSTTDLQALERALDRYEAEQKARATTVAQREADQHRLLGLEAIYRKYRMYRTLQTTEAVGASAGMAGIPGAPVALPIPGGSASERLRQELTTDLAAYNFASITDFETAIAAFEHSFEANAQAIAVDILDQYAGRMYREAQRYQDPAAVTALYNALSGYRQQMGIFERNATISNDYATNYERAKQPSMGEFQPKIGPDEARAAYETAVAAKQAAMSEYAAVAVNSPLLQEQGLPDDRKIDKTALAKADRSALGPLLQAQAARRSEDVATAKGLLTEKPERIYKLEKLMPRFYAEQHIEPDSIYDMIIVDKLHSDLVLKIAVSAALVIVAIALTVVTFGTATPAVIAAGASALSFGLSAYSAYEEYRNYVEQKGLAAVGFADDPSMVWLIIAVVAAALDLGSAAKAISKIGPAAAKLNVGGSYGEYVQVIAALKKDAVIEEKIAQAALKAGAARRAAVEAGEQLSAVLARHSGSLAKAFTDPEVYELLVRMAYARLKEGMHSSVVYVQELRKARALAKLGDLTPEEMVKAKEAWDQAVRLLKSAEEPIEIAGKKGATIGRYSNGSKLELVRGGAERSIHGGDVIKLDPEATTTVTGTLNDVNVVAKRGERLPGATVMGENQGGVNILRSPKWAEIQQKYLPLKATDPMAYWQKVTDEFWEVANKPWLDEAIARGDKFRFVSDPADELAVYVTDGAGNLIRKDGQKIKSIFGREVDYLKSQGYTFLADGTAIKAP